MGAAVRLRDLLEFPELNGLVGICNGPLQTDPGVCPVVLEIDGELEQKFVGPNNLGPVPRQLAPKWYTVPTCGCGNAHTPLCKPGCRSDEPRITWRLLAIPVVITVLTILIAIVSRDKVLAEQAIRRSVRSVSSAPVGHDEL